MLKRKFNTFKKIIEAGNPCNKFPYQLYNNIFKAYYSFEFNRQKGKNVTDDNWKYLIVLDACRYDTFKNHNFIKGKLMKSISKGSQTNEWINRNFKNRQLQNTVYISANDHIREVKQSFHKTINLASTNWNKKYGTVLPDKVSAATVQINEKYNEKRYILHYLQPHAPFIGKKKMYLEEDNDVGLDLFDLLRCGKIDKNKFYEAYVENLKYVLKSVEKLLPT